MNPIVSIIIPVYNVEKYLNQCLESVLHQSFPDWECFIVDDGSTDRSGTICDAWAQVDSRFKVIHKSNEGVSSARNFVLNSATGKYISFIDSDDWVDEDYLSDMLNSIDPSTGLVVSGLDYEDSRNPRSLFPPSEILINFLGKGDSSDWIPYINLLYGPCVKLYRKSIISRYGLFFPHNLSLGEDMIFNLSYLRYVDTIKFIPESNYHYRIQNEGTLSTIVREDRFDIEYSLWQARQVFFTEKQIWNDALVEYMDNQLWGIVYNGLFGPKHPSVKYLRRILTIPEIDSMKSLSCTFRTTASIKSGILRRDYLFFYILRRIKG